MPRLRAWLMLLALVVIPGCQSCNDEAEEQVGCDAQACQPGQVRFGDICVTPIPPGGACNGLFDPVCALDGNQPHVCKNGVCQPGPGFIAECDVGQPCAFSFQQNQPTYCKDKSCNNVTVDRCSLYADMYEPCDSDFLAPKCNACKPGLNCSQPEGICVKPCHNDGECPCDSNGKPTSRCIEYHQKYFACAPCVDAGGCDDKHPCCDASKQCTAGECCTPQGNACANTSECCGYDVCRDGVCSPCTGKNKPCSTDEECCGSNVCEGGLCREPCYQDKPCTVPGAQGVCADGKTQCGPQGSICVPTNSPSPETCNGLDDDCNGTTDDIPASMCTASNISGCQSGFTAPGTMACVNGAPGCVPSTVCKICGGNCGVCAATPCIPGVNACIPNAACTGPAGMEECHIDNYCPNPTPSCWLPTDVKLPPDHCYTP